MEEKSPYVQMQQVVESNHMLHDWILYVANSSVSKGASPLERL